MEKKDFSEKYSDRTRGNSHKLQQGTFHPHMGKWEKDVSVRGSHAGTGAQAGCSLSDPGDLQHFTGQGPRQRWDRYVALKLALV